MYPWRSCSATQKDPINCSTKISIKGAFVQIEGGFSHAPNDLSYGVDLKMIRWCGILQRIVPAYLVVALIEVLTHKFRPREIGSNPFAISRGYSWQCSMSAILSTTIGVHYGHVLIHYKNYSPVHIAAIPLNKQLYNINYVIFTAGLAGIVLSAFY
ncbi:hypothetical protein KSP40_PGU001505 [Platanthera guangdongensis]|uniref:Uncharacterized protein n=1 Tax=Platanthera guangdongensis TaxID=2320717 RepID=A0ABR2M3U3_9ASPA